LKKLTKNFDSMSLNFEELFDLLSTNSYGSCMKGNPPLDYVLKGTIEINNIHKNLLFLNLIKKIAKKHKLQVRLIK